VPKAAALLRPGGTLALFWNSTELDGDVQNDLDAVYRTRAPDLARAASGERRREPTYANDLDRSGLFEPSVARDYAWARRYARDAWAELIQTQSDHVVLEPERRVALVRAVGAVIDSHGGSIAVAYSTHAIFARVTAVRGDVAPSSTWS